MSETHKSTLKLNKSKLAQSHDATTLEEYLQENPSGPPVPSTIHDWTGIRIGHLVMVRYEGRIRKEHLWLMLCDCGHVVIKRPAVAEKSVHKKCLNCSQNRGSWTWQGYEDIPGQLFGQIKKCANAKGLEFNLTLEYLWELYINQAKRCALTGWRIYFEAHYKRKDGTSPSRGTATASLDRIDSEGGYTVGNVQWVHRDVNFLKRNYPNLEFIRMGCAIARTQSGAPHIDDGPIVPFKWLGNDPLKS